MAYSIHVRSVQRFDWLLFLLYLGLVGIGLMMVYTTTYSDTSQSMWSLQSIFGRQLLWAGISILLMLAVYMVDIHFWSFIALPLYVVGLVVLLLLLVVGVEVKGAQSWINIAGFSVQPAEFAKFTTGIFIASFLSSIKVKVTEWKSQLVIGTIILLPMILIVLQPDPGTALTFISLLILLYRKGLPTIYYTLSFAVFLVLILSLKFAPIVVIAIIFLVFALAILDFSKFKLRSVMIGAVLILFLLVSVRYKMVIYSAAINLVLAFFVLFYFNKKRLIRTKLSLVFVAFTLSVISFATSYSFNNFLKPHQQDRVNVWLNPEKCDPRGSMYNLIQSKLAIGSGGLEGKGFLNGNYTKLNYVPEQTTDFIFSSIGEEQGFIGGLGVIVLYLALLLRIVQIGEKSKFAFATNFTYVVAGFIFFHFFVNIGMTMGLAPVIGIPLPFISQGGSALLAFSMMIGVVLRMNSES